MTTYTKRRGRRSLAAILAAMLMASVLAVVAGAPAHAANTAEEFRVDHDSNPATPKIRLFAGRDRYQTAHLLAKNFATGQGGLGAVGTVIVASGESLVDSISAAGLAGYLNAPILLTRQSTLHSHVRDFIEDYGVSTVQVVGGPAAVSDQVLEDIRGLANTPTVPPRLAGPDRHGTAAAIAEQIMAGSSWCGTEARSAVLINGDTDALAFGVAVQTMAYRLQLPVLMTGADELSEAAADYIAENDIRHVQIIGGADTVSKAVESALAVDTVERTDGATAAEVSVKLAEMAHNGCGDDLAPVSIDHAVLVRGNPDGVAAAPALAASLDGGSLVTPLIVDDALPAEVRDYLAKTPKETPAGTKLHLGIVAVGGLAAVSQEVMDAATAAAMSSGDLTVRIGAGDEPTSDAREGDTNLDGKTDADDPVRPSGEAAGTFALYFSDDVVSGAASTAAATALTAKLRDMIEVNGAPASVKSAVTGVNAGACATNVVYVTLSQKLKAEDEISIVESDNKLGTNSDQRKVAPASAKVQAPPADRIRPAVTIIGIASPDAATSPGPKKFTVRVEDAGGLADDTVVASDFLYTRGPGSTNTADATLTVAETAKVSDSVRGTTSLTVTVELAADLVAGDQLTLKASAVKDNAGNPNSTRTGKAIKAEASPQISSVLMSSLKHSAHNSWTLPATAIDATTASDGANAITITAKADGDAAGAAGNAWSIYFDTASTYSAAKPKDIDVRVEPKGKRVTVRFVNGQFTVRDVVKELEASNAFDSRFAVSLPCTGTTNAVLAVETANRNVEATPTNAGRTQFAIEVNFNKYISKVDDSAHTALLADLLFAAATRAKVPNDNGAAVVNGRKAGIRTIATGSAGTDAGGGLSLGTQTAVTGPTKKVRYEGETALTHLLPQARDLVATAAGHAGAAAITGTPAFKAIPTVQAVAIGYAVDAPSAVGQTDSTTAKDKVDEDKNAASQRRIQVNNNVKARKF